MRAMCFLKNFYILHIEHNTDNRKIRYQTLHASEIAFLDQDKMYISCF